MHRIFFLFLTLTIVNAVLSTQIKVLRTTLSPGTNKYWHTSVNFYHLK